MEQQNQTTNQQKNNCCSGGCALWAIIAGAIVTMIVVVFGIYLLVKNTSFTSFLSGSTSTTSSNTALKCPDNEQHSKTLPTGEQLYWKCAPKTYNDGKTMETLTLYIVDKITNYPVNNRNKGFENRHYCGSYKLKGQSKAEDYCSILSYYKDNVEYTNKQNNLPFTVAADTVDVMYQTTLKKNLTKAEDIDELIMYTISVGPEETSTGRAQGEAPNRNPVHKTIKLNW